MIFYIFFFALVLAALALAVYYFVDNIAWSGVLENLWFSVLVALASGFGGLLILALYAGIASTGTPMHEKSTDYTLKALSNDSKQVGEYAGSIFISYGYTDEERTINYIWQDSEGYFNLDQIGVEEAKIREVPGGTEATVTVIRHVAEDTAWLPADWSFAETFSTDEYIFTVPEGTIGSDLSIDNSK